MILLRINLEEIMRKISIILTLLLCCLIITGTAFAESLRKKNNLQVSIGAFTPGSDYESEWESGPDVSVNYIRNFNSFLAIDLGLHIYNTEYSESGYIFGTEATLDAKVTSVGFEPMLRLYTDMNGFRPYVSLGLGSYANKLEVTVRDNAGNEGSASDSGTAFGGILKIGADYIFKNGFYIGADFKKFTNNQDFEDTDEEIDLGGSSFSAVVGYHF